MLLGFAVQVADGDPLAAPYRHTGVAFTELPLGAAGKY